jgi:ABC-type Zn uptake system ZnuABC Zn-binding protein ZnuA
MNKQRKPLLYLALMVMIVAPFLGACQSNATPDADASGKLNTTVSIVPLAYFTERVGGDWVNVNIMVGPGESPHTYEPTPEKMVAVSESPIFFSVGVEYEHVWLPKFEDANPDMMVVDTSIGIERIPVVTRSLTSQPRRMTKLWTTTLTKQTTPKVKMPITTTRMATWTPMSGFHLKMVKS